MKRFSIKESDKLYSTLNSTNITKNSKSEQRKSGVVFRGKSLSIYFKIFLNYAQMIGIIHNLQLKWPFYVETYLKFSGNMGTFSTQLFSFDCLISDFDLNINAIYLKAIASLIIYIGFLLLASSFFGIRHILMKKRKENNHLIIATIVLSIMIQPTSIKDTSDILNCIGIQDESYLVQEMSIQCYTTEHYKWVNIENNLLNSLLFI